MGAGGLSKADPASARPMTWLASLSMTHALLLVGARKRMEKLGLERVGKEHRGADAA